MSLPFKPCPVDGCERNAHWRSGGSCGFCTSHYRRWKKYGDPKKGPTERGAPMKFLMDVALTYDGDECIKWPFSGVRGYGQILYDGRMQMVSRIVCAEVNGPPPSPIHEAAHSCGKGHDGCITPGHLSWKTPKENQADKYLHGTIRNGESSPAAKLSEEQVIEILSLKGRVLQQVLADRYGVTRQAIGDILSGRNWSHVHATSIGDRHAS